jgi:DNA-binding transcriptional LysR family regulator
MRAIRPVNVAALDLNLIKVLHALLEECSVTAAGRRVGLSQPATSSALRRLREILNDPLLVRGTDGYRCTPHAESLRGPVNAAIAALSDAFRQPERFEPALASLTIRLAATDLATLATLPNVLPRLVREAPGIDLAIRSGDREEVFAWLREGAVDVALGVFPAIPGDCLAEPLFRDSFELLLRPGHPLLDGELTAERLAGFPAVLVSPGGHPRGIVDTALEKLGLRRRVAVTVPHFLMAPHLIRASDMTLTFPRRLVAVIAHPFGLITRPIPLPLPEFVAKAVWLKRNDGHQPLIWLRQLIREVTD